MSADVTYYAHWTAIVAAVWFTNRADAIAEARKTGKKIFLICGRDTCYNTMTTKNVSCEEPAVKAALTAKCVLWYSNCDTQEAENWYYWPMGVSVTLPLVCVIDPDDPYHFIKRTTGGDHGGPLRGADLYHSETFDARETVKDMKPSVVNRKFSGEFRKPAARVARVL